MAESKTVKEGRGKALANDNPRRERVLNEILDRAAELFAQKGFDATTLGDIADAMDMTRPALYYYIRNKDDLLAALVKGLTQAIAADLTSIRRKRGLTPEDKLRDAVRHVVTEIAHKSARFRLLDRSEASLPERVAEVHLEAKRRVLVELTALVENGIRSGAFRPVDPRTAAFAIVGSCNWVAWWYREDYGSVGTIADQFSQMAVASVLRADARKPEPGVSGALSQLREDIDYLERLVP